LETVGTGETGNEAGGDGNGTGFAGFGELAAGLDGAAGRATRLFGCGQQSIFAEQRGHAADSPMSDDGAWNV
jgi:hypothetical protein